MRRQLMGGLVAVVTGVVVSASGVTDVRASLVAPSTPVAARAASPMAPVAPGPAAQLWVARYNGPGNINDLANSVAVSPAGGTVFVTGASGGSSLKYDYGPVAYDAATGAPLWGGRYKRPPHRSHCTPALAGRPRGGAAVVTRGRPGAPPDAPADWPRWRYFGGGQPGGGEGFRPGPQRRAPLDL